MNLYKFNKEYIKDIIDEIIYESVIGKNPFKEGDLVKLRPDVLKRHSQSVPAHAGYTKNEFSWRETLNKLVDKTGKITRVFPDSKHVNVEFPQSWTSKDEYGRDYAVNTIGIDYTELLPANKPEVEEGFGYVSDKDMKKDPKHIPGERWRIKFNENMINEELNNESFGKTTRNTFLSVLAALSMAAATPDGWRHTGATNSTSEMYMRGDFIIAHKSQHAFVLINRADGKYVRIGEFKTLQQAKDAAVKTEKNVNINEVKSIIKELIREMWTGFEEGSDYWHPLDNSSQAPKISTDEPKLSMASQKSPVANPKTGETNAELRDRLLAKLRNSKVSEASRDRNYSIGYTLPKPQPDENPLEYLKKHFKNHPLLQAFLKKQSLKKK